MQHSAVGLYCSAAFLSLFMSLFKRKGVENPNIICDLGVIWRLVCGTSFDRREHAKCILSGGFGFGLILFTILEVSYTICNGMELKFLVGDCSVPNCMR